MTESSWATICRVLALVALFATAAATFEGVALNRARLEVQTLRNERDEVKSGLASEWAKQSRDEVSRAIAGVNDFYADPQEGLGRAGGLCAGGSLNAQPILDFVLDAYVPARARGRSVAAAAEAMNTAIRSTDDYRAVHPNQTNR